MKPRPSSRERQRSNGEEEETDEELFELGVFPRLRDSGLPRDGAAAAAAATGAVSVPPRASVLTSFAMPPSQQPETEHSPVGRPNNNYSSTDGSGTCTLSPPLSPSGGLALPSSQRLPPSSMLLPHARYSPTPVGGGGGSCSSSSSGGRGNGNEELWMSIERYLLAAYTALHEGDESQLRPLKTPKHRMGWYATVYNACNGNPANSRELYARLALAILHALEAFVLYPMLHHADRSRLVVVTDQEGASASAGSGSGARGQRQSKDSAKGQTAKNDSFRFVRRLFFGDSDGHHHHREGRRNSKQDSSPSTALQVPGGGAPGITIATSAAAAATGSTGAELASPAPSSAATASPFFGFGTPFHQGVTAARCESTSSPLSIRSNNVLTAPGTASGRETPTLSNRQDSLYDERGAAVAAVEQQQQRGCGPLSRQHSGATPTTGHPARSPSSALISPDTGRVLVDDEEMLLPDMSRTPPDSFVTLPSTPTPRTNHHHKGVAAPAGSTAATAAEQSQVSQQQSFPPEQPAAATHTATEQFSPESRKSSSGAVHSTACHKDNSISNNNNDEGDKGSGSGSGGGGGRGQGAQYSPCRAFCREYDTFALFRRIVLSCFRYLDQYYTKRFGMDTLTMMCVKLFYVIVYEPVKPLLVDELFTKLARLREAHNGGGGGPRDGPASFGFAIPEGDEQRVAAAAAFPGSRDDDGGPSRANQGPATAMAMGADSDFKADVQLVQQTLAVITDLITSVRMTTSYLVAGDLPTSGGGGGIGSNTTSGTGGMGSGRQSPAARGLGGASTTIAVRTGSISPAAPGATANASFAADTNVGGDGSSSTNNINHEQGVVGASRSAPNSAASTPRFRPFDLLARSPRTPTAVTGSGVTRSASASATAATRPPQKESKRRRLIDFFKSNHHNHSSTSGASDTAAAAAAADVAQASPGPHAEEHRLDGNSPVTSLERGGSEGQLANSGSAEPARLQSPIVVDLRGTLELRNRLESRSLAHSLASQAMYHSELYGGGSGAVGTDQQQQPQTGTIIKEIGKPLTSLIGNDFGDKYMVVLECFYREERARHMSTPEARRGYVRWVQSVFAFERALLQSVTVPFIHSSVQAILSATLLVQAHRAIILDADSGFRRLLEVWAGDRTDDAFVLAILGDDAMQESAAQRNSSDNAHNANNTTSAMAMNLHSPRDDAAHPCAFNANSTCHSRIASNSVGSFVAMRSPEDLSPMSSEVFYGRHARTHTRTPSTATATTVFLPPTSRHYTATEEDKANAVGFYYGIFAMSNDESCGLLMAAVLATKVIEDCAALFSAYLQRVANAGRGGEGSRSGLGYVGDALSASGLLSHPSLCDTPLSSPQSSQIWGGRTSHLCQRGQHGEAGGHPPQTPEATIAAAGNALAEKLVGIYASYATLIRQHVQDSPVLQGALNDAMVVVLNPSRWARSGAAAAAAAAAVTAAAAPAAPPSTAELGEGASGGTIRVAAAGLVRQQHSSNSPNVLLSRDAGAKATAPLRAIIDAEPLAANLSVPALLAMYCNHLCGKRLAGRRIDVPVEWRLHLAQMAQMVTLLDDKDVFLEDYKERLARRLLATTANTEVERVLVQQLQLRLGVGSVHAFEAMLRDCVNTKHNTVEFQQTDMFKMLPTPITTHLLSCAQWPSYRIIPLTPHPSLSAGMSAFADYYLRIHPSRTLRWLHLLGSARLTAEYPRGNKDITANTLQATILLIVSDAYNRDDGDSEGDGEDAHARSSTEEKREGLHDLVDTHALERSRTTSRCTSESNDENNDDSPRDMHTVTSLPSSLHGGDDDGPLTPKDASELNRSSLPADSRNSSLTAPPCSHTSPSTSLAGAAGPRLASLLANLTSTAFSTYRRARPTAVEADGASEDGDEDVAVSESGEPSRAHAAVDEVQPSHSHSHPLSSRRGRGSITGEAIAKRMGLSFADIRPHLTSVVLSRGVPLLKCLTDDAESAPTTGREGATPPTAAARPLRPTDRFILHEGFTHRLRKMQLPVPRLRRVPAILSGDGIANSSGKIWAFGSFDDGGTSGSASTTAAGAARGGEEVADGGGGEIGDVFTRVPANIQAMRRQQLDAAIVRVMKRHREMAYHDLVTLVTQQVSRLFMPTARDIKVELEALVEREFITRSRDTDDVFLYNA